MAAEQPKKWVISSDEEAFLEIVERDTFNFFWKTTNPRNGLTPDRFPDPPFSSIAGVGFALTAYPVGAKRGYVSRAQAAERTLATLDFLWQAPQGPQPSGVSGHKGFFYHFLAMDTGRRYGESELSTIDTALLMAGVLFAQTYFVGESEIERKIRERAEEIYRRVDWKWAYSEKHKPLLSMG
ncbi:MAG TPA: Tat pathway signal protein, partial [Thermodesulfobacteriota bacterium]|nr:Tat pathway signal protein [Thermodesulfobacteriota bacterium]